MRRAATALRGAGATLIAGHSAHVFHGVRPGILYDLADSIDDYAVNPRLRNDLGHPLPDHARKSGTSVSRATPLKLEFCHTRLADRDDAAWIGRRFRMDCVLLGTDVAEQDGRLVVVWRS